MAGAIDPQIAGIYNLSGTLISDTAGNTATVDTVTLPAVDKGDQTL